MTLDEWKGWFVQWVARGEKLKARGEMLNVAIRSLEEQIGDFQKDIEKYEALKNLIKRYEELFAKSKVGRRPIWEGEPGFALYDWVEGCRKAMERAGRKTTTEEILQTMRTNLAADHPLRKVLLKRDLKIRYSEVKRYWGPKFEKLRQYDAEFAELVAGMTEGERRQLMKILNSDRKD